MTNQTNNSTEAKCVGAMKIVLVGTPAQEIIGVDYVKQCTLTYVRIVSQSTSGISITTIKLNLYLNEDLLLSPIVYTAGIA